MLLLSAIASAETRAARAAEQDLHVQYAGLLMQQGSVAALPEEAFPCGTQDALKLNLTASFRAHVKTVWSMRPPSAHCAMLQDFTGSRV